MAQTTPNMSLRTWDLLIDNFSHADLRANWLAVDQHDHTSGKGVQIGAGGLANLTVGTPTIADQAVTTGKLASGAVTTNEVSATAGIVGTQLSSSAALKVGQIGGGGGKSNISTTESRTNTAYGTLTTPDQVTGVVLPTGGLIAVAYQATWQESVNAAARAAIFIGANQLKVANTGSAAPVAQEAQCGMDLAIDGPLTTYMNGLLGSAGTSATAYTGEVSTGQVVGDTGIGNSGLGNGGLCYIFAAAGTYTVSVQFKASSGSVTVKNRKLWVWTLGF